MSEPGFASLGPSLLARKGGARPAMRPAMGALAVQQATVDDDDLGWNDMGGEVLPLHGAAELPKVVRQQRDLATEALAGTVARAADGSLSSSALTEDDKIQLENQLVAQDIISRLAPLAEQWQLGANEISQQAAVAHLRRPIQARLQAGVSDFALLRALHPTPAVGGLPREAALAHIRAIECYPRGWYAGAVGYLGHAQSEMTVAIRSALIEGRQLHLFAGAGLVKGSDAASEWQELNHKLSTQLQILGLSR